MRPEIKAQICQQDFYDMLESACEQAGGGQVERLKRMCFSDVVNLLAQNGIRMVYMPDRHMDSLNVSWQAPKKDSPTSKTLLTDGKKYDVDPVTGEAVQ